MIRRQIDDVLSLLEKVRPAGNNHRDGSPRFDACCPVHDDNRASMSIDSKADGRILFHCHVGCDFRDIEAWVKDRLPYEEQRPSQFSRFDRFRRSSR